MKFWFPAMVLVLLLYSGGNCLCQEAIESEFKRPDRSYYNQGRYVYQKNCLMCHGRFGRGDGELVQGWEILPRNFSLGIFKYRSTPFGKLPTDEDLTRTIRRGVSGTAMPTFAKLTDSEIRAVVEYIKFLSPAWYDPSNHAAPMEEVSRPDWFDLPEVWEDRHKEASDLYNLMCSPCHGQDGSGDGPAALQLVDEQQKPIRPADLRRSTRAGTHAEDVFRTLSTGISGTPMPSFLEALDSRQRWLITWYVLELRKKEMH